MQTESPKDLPARETKMEPEPFSLEKTKLNALVLRFLNRLKVSGRSPHTISAYRNDLHFFVAFLRDSQSDPTLSSTTIVDDWSEFLIKNGRNSQASQRRAQMSVRTFLHFLVESRVIFSSPFLNRTSPKQPRNDLFVLPHSQFEALCKHLNAEAQAKDPKALRDLALAKVLGICGLKASEAAALTWRDLGLPARGKGTLVVQMGEKARLVSMDAALKKAFVDLKNSSDQDHTRPGDSVFFGYQNISRRLSPKGMQRHSIKFVIYEISQEILGFPYNSESFRNHAILEWFKAGQTIEKVAEWAGYSSLQSLDRFLTPDSTLAHFRRKQKATRSAQNHDTGPGPEADR